MTDDIVSAALELGAKGFSVFPITTNSKIPNLKKWNEKASRNPEDIKEMFSSYYKPNIAIHCSTFKDGYLTVIDLDVSEKIDGVKAFEALCKKHSIPPIKTKKVMTPSGGFHYYFRTREPVKNSASEIAPGVDVRSENGYVLAEKSQIDGKIYQQCDSYDQVAFMPEKLFELLSAPKPKAKPEKKTTIKLDLEANIKRATEFLQSEKPAIEGLGGDEWTYKVSCKVRDLGISQNKCFELMDQHWNGRCEPPWDAEELEAKISNAYNYAQNSIGERSPESQFDKIDSELEQAFRELEKEWCFVTHDGRFHAVRKRVSQDGIVSFDLARKVDFFDHNESKTVNVKVGKKIKREEVARLYVKYPKRLHYTDGIEYDPTNSLPSTVLNTFQGFAKQPIEGDVKPFLEFTKNIITGGSEKHASHLIKLIAYRFQNLGEPGHCAPVIFGDKGCGKTFFCDIFRTIIGPQHSLNATDPDKIFGRFNDHMLYMSLVVFPEMFILAKKHQEMFKSYITDSYFSIEGKYGKIGNAKNKTFFLITSNENHVVQTSANDRRFFILEVDNSKQNDTEYFSSLQQYLNSGGYEAIYYYLLNLDLTDFNPRIPPKTKAWEQHVIMGMDSIHRWLFNSLSHASIHFTEWTEEGLRINCQLLQHDYVKSLSPKEKGETTDRGFQTSIGMNLNKVFKRKIKQGHDYLLPPLSEARVHFSQFHGLDRHDWG
jgi:hypothetical protein